MATHSSVLAWRIPGTVEPVSHNLKRIPEIREHSLPGKWARQGKSQNKKHKGCSLDSELEESCQGLEQELQPAWV